jgi:hypothetical protein
VSLSLGVKAESLLWLEGHRILTQKQRRPSAGQPTEDQLAQALTALPQGPTQWVVDDLWAPALLMRDIAELPSGHEAQEAFFRWRFQQALGLEVNHSVQALQTEPGIWLASGLPQAQLDAWVALSLKLGRPISSLQPRWLWLYNRLAPKTDMPGALLSLAPAGNGHYTGTLAAWGRTLTLLRQWTDPMDAEGWIEERLAPTAYFLQRDGKNPQSLSVWGAEGAWPASGIPTTRLDDSLLAEVG